MRKPWIVLSRPGKLALKQAEEVMSCFPDQSYDLRTISSYGDKHRDVSLFSAIPADFFTRELDQALLNNQGDIAIHPAKDLPFPIPPGLETIALFKAPDKTDALVSKNHIPLNQLPSGSRVGTSSPNRKTQLLQLRDDLDIVPIRGNIEERLNLIETGIVDALIVATCAMQRLGLQDQITEILPFETHPLQGNLAVLAKMDRNDLKIKFYDFDVRNQFGKVYLVGAGPGDPDQLTLKADKVLKSVDVIYYDDLICFSLLDRYLTEKIYVGKRRGKHSISQDEIHDKIYASVLAGKWVARLKNGDPFIYGRGGEELQYLQERLVDVVVIPGISAAQQAAASSQIPLTLRGKSNRIQIFTGHKASSLKTTAETLIYYMAASRINEIASKLLNDGKDANLPVALVENAGWFHEKITITSLSQMKAHDVASPLLILMGPTVQQFSQRPRILFTGLDPTHCPVRGELVHYPVIQVSPIPFQVDQFETADAVLFTSKTAVQYFCESYKLFAHQKTIVIGSHTGREIQRFGYSVDLMPEIADSDHLTDWIQKHHFKRILYPCSQISNNQLHQLSQVEKIVIYKTSPRSQPQIPLELFSGIVFCCISTVDAFFAIYAEIPNYLIIYVYGEPTANHLRDMGYGKQIQKVQISKGFRGNPKNVS